MAEKKVSVKHLKIDKTQQTILAVVALATALSIFSLVATKALVSKGLYQRRALHARRDAAAQLKTNYDSAQKLFTQYKVFADADPNVIGGVKTGNADRDGDNPKIVLDALPSTYDAPALAASLEKILTTQKVQIGSITVTDDPATNSDQPQASPQPKQVSFSVSATTDYKGAQALLQKFEQSIRPFDLTVMDISGTDSSLHLDLQMTTYYQPAKSLDLTVTKEVK